MFKISIVRILSIALCALLLISCECRRTASGNVLDISTKLPIDSVFVKGIERVYNEYYTNSEGEYYMTTGMIGAVGGCPSITISFSKEGYYEKTLINPNGDVYLMKK
ncbi:hypothetical protein CW751_11090 [Brumimicrobium salinarum]|uniref:Uncharacterized protein n=1 Tax=Brumimicrobium salinarum TaxID=2058658 RepID=A0A2I0R1C5_9FLAO|nr:hypothetical protein [Brumimicrobium salinarum]PKR80200.1 hypothetical protein CW751_11090 [Brumimicrobium salinarum]